MLITKHELKLWVFFAFNCQVPILLYFAFLSIIIYQGFQINKQSNNM